MLTWATYETLRRPDLRARVVDEARALFDVEGCARCVRTPEGICGVPSRERIERLVHTPAILREALRMHSVVPVVMRRAVHDDVFAADEAGLPRDVHLPAGCVVAIGIEGVHKNPTIWPDPDHFNPDRFLNVDPPQAIDPYGFIPFINGPRNCLGQHFALVEAQVALAFMHYRWDLALFRDPATDGDDETWQKEIGRHHDYIIPQVPHDGLKVTGTLRSQLG
ncbi:unnamed protein product [Phytomonas sp. Hart1]|nr:unnamed protein product [Phytomonas sp. Hart1]|eukprot:CCW71143.1 unnamed protein product [Phytomonas sp. isolate Hart1]